jgi:hypothetical protein
MGWGLVRALLDDDGMLDDGGTVLSSSLFLPVPHDGLCGVCCCKENLTRAGCSDEFRMVCRGTSEPEVEVLAS